MTQRLKLELAARRQRVIGCLVNDAATGCPALSAPAAASGRALEGVAPEMLSDRCAAEWSQWAIAKAKLSLFSSEVALQQASGHAELVSRRVAAHAIDRLRQHALPPLLAGDPTRLVGSWCLVQPTEPARFGDCALSELSRGLHAAYDRSPTCVEVQFVVRTFEADGVYGESTFFADLATARWGAFSELGHFRLLSANALQLTPTQLSLTIEQDETELTGFASTPRTLIIGYLDGDLFLEGPHDAKGASVLAWGRDHDIELQAG